MELGEELLRLYICKIISMAVDRSWVMQNGVSPLSCSETTTPIPWLLCCIA